MGANVDQRVGADAIYNEGNINKAKRIYANEKQLFDKAFEMCNEDTKIGEEYIEIPDLNERYAKASVYQLKDGQKVYVFEKTFDYEAGKPAHKFIKIEKDNVSISLGEVVEDVDRDCYGQHTVANSGYVVRYQAKDAGKIVIDGEILDITEQRIKNQARKIEPRALPDYKFGESILPQVMVGDGKEPVSITSTYENRRQGLTNKFDKSQERPEQLKDITVLDEGDTFIDILDNMPDKSEITETLVNDFKDLIQPFADRDLQVATPAEIDMRNNAKKIELKDAEIKGKDAEIANLSAEKSELEKKIAELTRQNEELQGKNKTLEDKQSKALIVIEAYKSRTSLLENVINKQNQFIKAIMEKFNSVKKCVEAIKGNMKPTSFLEKIAAKFSKKKDEKIQANSDNIETTIGDAETEYRKLSMTQLNDSQSTDDYVRSYVKEYQKEGKTTINKDLEEL